ncbi:MAG TPA: hypothetical protein PLX89_07705 [Verrucomicrobiota bacterium]|nr:hypothetical protein [Verrucomicrobiales bacterium]HRI12874.1 hypothetical protein [Verrucomicrobiota bacterium]
MTTHVDESDDFEVSQAPKASARTLNAPPLLLRRKVAPTAPAPAPVPQAHLVAAAGARKRVLSAAKAEATRFHTALEKWHRWAQEIEGPLDPRQVEARVVELESEILNGGSPGAVRDYVSTAILADQLATAPEKFGQVRRTLERATKGKFESDVRPHLLAFVGSLEAELNRAVSEAQTKELEILGDTFTGDGPLTRRVCDNCSDLRAFIQQTRGSTPAGYPATAAGLAAQAAAL